MARTANALRKERRKASEYPEYDLEQYMRVCLVGRPNTGKSTLFNRLSDRRRQGGGHKSAAIVADIPGTTRDFRESPAQVAGVSFTVVDTGGLEEEDETDANFRDIQKRLAHVNVASRGGAGGVGMGSKMLERTASVVQNSTLTLFLIDLRAGITAADRRFATWLRRTAPKGHVILLANKAEGYITEEMEETIHDSYQLGFGEPELISAHQGEGMGTLVQHLLRTADAVVDALAAQGYAEEDTEHEGVEEPLQGGQSIFETNEDEDPNEEYDELEELGGDDSDARDDGKQSPEEGPIKIALVGRPNAGKSSLVNHLLKEDRVLSGPMPGLTRDSIVIDWKWRNRDIQLVDTAGIRKTGQRDRSNALEGMATLQSFHAISRADIVVLLLDGTSKEPYGLLESSLANKVVKEGRGIVFAVSKVDIAYRAKTATDLRQQIHSMLSHRLPHGIAPDPPVVPISSVTGEGVAELFNRIVSGYKRWDRRVTTGMLNRWLRSVLRHHPPPRHGRFETKFRYVTQVKSRPPTFCIFGNVDEVPNTYVRYLRAAIAKEFNMRGTPIRLLLRKARNPYSNKPSK